MQGIVLAQVIKYGIKSFPKNSHHQKKRAFSSHHIKFTYESD
ncbi:hypothetical protein BSM4216_2801 [Bacillus smithii]|nr:hypothetical protein BSM4216_2801 [Bacillus smithii]